MFDTASPLEVAYTLPSLAGFLLAVWLLKVSVCDELARRRVRVNGLVRLDVQKSIVTAAALVVSLGCLTWIGVNAMATPPNPNIRLDPATAATTVQNAVLFVAVDAALIALAAYRLLQRDAVRREMTGAARRDRRHDDPPSHERRPQGRP